jgi:ribonuclease HI
MSGVADAGGFLYDPGGHEELSYAWSLGTCNNNQAEAYAPLQGLKLALAHQISSITVIGDDSVIIQSMHKTLGPTNYKITTILSECRKRQKGSKKLKNSRYCGSKIQKLTS